VVAVFGSAFDGVDGVDDKKAKPYYYGGKRNIDQTGV
jgi:hypothetical protein